MNERRHPYKSWCPKCKGDWRYNNNNVTIICANCGYVTEAKRVNDKYLLPAREKEMLKEGGY